MHTETRQLNELKDYKDKLFRNEGGRDVLSNGEYGMHNDSKSGPLHPSFCQLCGQCYYRPDCVIGDPNLVYLGRGFRDAIRRILRRGA